MNVTITSQSHCASLRHDTRRRRYAYVSTRCHFGITTPEVDTSRMSGATRTCSLFADSDSGNASLVQVRDKQTPRVARYFAYGFRFRPPLQCWQLEEFYIGRMPRTHRGYQESSVVGATSRRTSEGRARRTNVAPSALRREGGIAVHYSRVMISSAHRDASAKAACCLDLHGYFWGEGNSPQEQTSLPSSSATQRRRPARASSIRRYVPPFPWLRTDTSDDSTRPDQAASGRGALPTRNENPSSVRR